MSRVAKGAPRATDLLGLPEAYERLVWREQQHSFKALMIKRDDPVSRAPQAAAVKWIVPIISISSFMKSHTTHTVMSWTNYYRSLSIESVGEYYGPDTYDLNFVFPRHLPSLENDRPPDTTHPLPPRTRLS